MFRKTLIAIAILLGGCSRHVAEIDASAQDASVADARVKVADATADVSLADAEAGAPRFKIDDAGKRFVIDDAGHHVGGAFGAVGGDLKGSLPEPQIAAIDGINLPAPSGTSTVLTYGGGALTWSVPPGAGDGGTGVTWA
ncbi:MAG TPA: hypothetical protein VN894_11800, partial [Polyangiaceae bacterium]|nr:hypothetical protein [Polyangiaceae bacterium]